MCPSVFSSASLTYEIMMNVFLCGHIIFYLIYKTSYNANMERRTPHMFGTMSLITFPHLLLVLTKRSIHRKLHVFGLLLRSTVI